MIRRTAGYLLVLLAAAYLYFMYDPRSDFSFEIIDSDRDLRVKESIGLDST